MAIQKITEKPVAAELSEDAYVLVTQKETVHGVAVEVLRRAPKALIGGSDTVQDVAHGGTGAEDAAGARTNLEVYSKSEIDNLMGDIGNILDVINGENSGGGSN